jgi:hypothetical protein
MMKQSLFHSILLYILATEVLLALVPSVAAQQDDCPEGYPGDGYCDAECNTAMHDWDKGDCCEETCLSMPSMNVVVMGMTASLLQLPIFSN